MPSTYSESFGDTGTGPTPCEGDWRGICFDEAVEFHTPAALRAPVFVEDIDGDGNEEIIFSSGQVLDLANWPSLQWTDLALGEQARVVGTVWLGESERFAVMVLHDDGLLELVRSPNDVVAFEAIAPVVIAGNRHPASFVVAADLKGYPNPGIDEVLVLEVDTIRVFSKRNDGFVEDTPIDVAGCRGGMSVFRFDTDPWDDIAIGCDRAEIFRSAGTGQLESAYTIEYGEPNLAPIGFPRGMVEGGTFFPVLLEEAIWFVPRPSTGSNTLVGGTFGTDFATLGWSSWPDQPIMFRNGRDSGVYSSCPKLDLPTSYACGLPASLVLSGIPVPSVAHGLELLSLVRDAEEGGSEIEIRPVSYHPAQ